MPGPTATSSRTRKETGHDRGRDSAGTYWHRGWRVACSHSRQHSRFRSRRLDCGTTPRPQRPGRSVGRPTPAAYHREVSGWRERPLDDEIGDFFVDYFFHYSSVIQRIHRGGSVSAGVSGGVGFRGRPAVGEGDGECVESGLPTHRPSGAATTGGVEATSDKIQALQGGLLGREMPACPDGPPVSRVQRFDRVRGADHGADLKGRSPGTG